MSISISVAKNQAKILKDYLKQANAGISHSSCLHAIAKINGYKDWNTLSGLHEKEDSSSASNHDNSDSTNSELIQISEQVLIQLMNGGRSGNLDLNSYKTLFFILHKLEQNSVSLPNKEEIGKLLRTASGSKHDFDHVFNLLVDAKLIIERRGVCFINPNWFWKGDKKSQRTFLETLYQSDQEDDGFLTNHDYANQIIKRFRSDTLPMNAQFELDHFGMNRLVVTLDRWLSDFDVSSLDSNEKIELDDKKDWLREEIEDEANKLFSQTWFRQGINSQWLSDKNDEGYMVEYYIDINHPLMKESLDLIINRLLGHD